MPCPTCDHTMSCITADVFHCPRCGTLKCTSGNKLQATPALVQRCRRLHTGYSIGPERNVLQYLGITDSCFLPAERPGN